MSTYSDCFERFLAQKFKDENDCTDTTELNQDIEVGQKAAHTVCQYVDWLLSTKHVGILSALTQNSGLISSHAKWQNYKLWRNIFALSSQICLPNSS